MADESPTQGKKKRKGTKEKDNEEQQQHKEEEKHVEKEPKDKEKKEKGKEKKKHKKGNNDAVEENNGKDKEDGETPLSDKEDGAKKERPKVPPLSPKSRGSAGTDEVNNDKGKDKVEEEEEGQGNEGGVSNTNGKEKDKKKKKVPKIRQRAHTIADAPKSKSKLNKSNGELSPDNNKDRKGGGGGDAKSGGKKGDFTRARGGSMIVRGSKTKKELRRDKTASLVLDKEASIERVLSMAKEKKTHKPTAESLFFHDNEDESYNIFSPRPDVRTLLNDSHMKLGEEDENKENKEKKRRPSLFKRLIMKKNE